jgi:hypothetical protein
MTAETKPLKGSGTLRYGATYVDWGPWLKERGKSLIGDLPGYVRRRRYPTSYNSRDGIFFEIIGRATKYRPLRWEAIQRLAVQFREHYYPTFQARLDEMYFSQILVCCEEHKYLCHKLDDNWAFFRNTVCKVCVFCKRNIVDIKDDYCEGELCKYLRERICRSDGRPRKKWSSRGDSIEAIATFLRRNANEFSSPLDGGNTRFDLWRNRGADSREVQRNEA